MLLAHRYDDESPVRPFFHHLTSTGGAANGIEPQANVGAFQSSSSSTLLVDAADFSSGSESYGSAETGAAAGGGGAPKGVGAVDVAERALPKAPKPPPPNAEVVAGAAEVVAAAPSADPKAPKPPEPKALVAAGAVVAAAGAPKGEAGGAVVVVA